MPQLPSKAAKLVNRGAAGLLTKSAETPTAAPQTLADYRSLLIRKWPDAATLKVSPQLKKLVVPLATLVRDPNNARLHNERNLRAIMHSLAAFGQKTPLMVRAEGRVVMAGNGRMEAMQALGWTHAAVNVESMTDSEAAGYALADNRTAELASWDFETAARLERLAETAGYGGVGWTTDELKAMLRGQQQKERDPDKVPEPPKIPVSRLGDLWMIGRHRLLCGDSSSQECVQELMGDAKACLMATDPPYGVDFAGQKYNPRAKAWAGIVGDKTQGSDLREWVAKFLGVWLPDIDKRSAFYIWTAPMQEGYATLQGIRDAGIHVQAQIVWAKNVLVLGQADYQWKHEVAWYGFWKGEKHRWFGARDKTTVWEVQKVNNADYLHPMQKPTELYEIPMTHHTVEGDVVAEPFAGSGTQFIASEKLGRTCYGMELDPVYVDVCCQRYLDYTGTDPVREDGVSFSSLKQRTLETSASVGNGEASVGGGTVSSRTKASPPRPTGKGRGNGRPRA